MSTYVAGRAGFGSVFSFSTVGSTGTYTDCANILGINPPKASRGVTDVSNWGTTDYYKQYIQSGLIDAGTLGFNAIYLSTNSQQTSLIKEAMENGTRIGWKITMSGTSSNNILYGDGFVTDTQVLIPDDKVTFTCTITVTGKPTGWTSSTT